MAVVSIATLKSYFETGDTPTQAQFIDLMDTLFSMVQNVGDQTIEGNKTFEDNIENTGELIKTDDNGVRRYIKISESGEVYTEII